MLVLALLPGMPPAQAATLPPNAAGLSVTVDEATGAYSVTTAKFGWTFAGTVGGPLLDVRQTTGRDKLGAFRQIQMAWTAKMPLMGTIRVYETRPLVAFTETTQAQSGPTPDFPAFTTFPQNLHSLSFHDQPFSPPAFTLQQNGTPWIFFDDRAQTAVLSPASDFLISQMHGDGKALIGSGLNAAVDQLPAGFAHQTFLVVGPGIGQTVHVWGDALCDLSAKPRPTDDSDPLIKYLGYWTDNGAFYYYNYDKTKGYAGTLLALRDQYKSEHIPIRYLQLDSWWYQKSLRSYDGTMGKPKNANLPLQTWNRYGGTLDYTAAPELFPQGLAAFGTQFGMPLAVHGRWLDPTGPYAQTYKLSGIAPIDPRWWDDRMAYLKANGVVCYEQDWLSETYNHTPAMHSDPTIGAAYADNMARAAQANGLTLQYCMAPPRFFLQGSRYANLTTIRTSDDRFERRKWNSFLYTSLLADSLRVRPWTDVLMSNEPGNLTIAALSSGPVGIGDALGKESPENLQRAARADGVLVKPDAPLLPIDASILADAHQARTPLVCATYTGQGFGRTAYVFACTRPGDTPAVSFSPADVGVSGPAYVYNTADGTAKRVNVGDTFADTLGLAGWACYTVASVSPSGIAFLGDAGKFVGTGRQRITAVNDQKDRLTVTVYFAPDEDSVTLHGYAASAPTAQATSHHSAAGPVAYDAATGHWSATISAPHRALRGMNESEMMRLVTVVFQAGGR